MKDLLMESQIEKIDELLTAVRRSQEFLTEPTPTPKPEKSLFLGLTQKEIRQYSVSRLAMRIHDRVNGNGHINGSTDGFEYECHQALEKIWGYPVNRFCSYLPGEITHQRALSTTPGSKGGYLVAPDIVGFADGLYNASVCLQLGAQRIQDQSTTVVYVKEKTAPTVTWQGGDGQSTTPADPSFVQISGSPHTAIAIHEQSEQLLRQASLATEAGVRRNLSLALGSNADGGMLTGPGGAQLLGVTNTIGINTVSGGTITRAVLLDMQQQSANSNALILPTAQGYVCPAATAALLAGRQEFAGVATTQWQGGLVRGTVCGVPAMTTKGMTAGALLFGDFSQLMLVEFGPIQLTANSSDTRFNQGIVAIRALWMVDVLVLEPKSFTLASSVS